MNIRTFLKLIFICISFPFVIYLSTISREVCKDLFIRSELLEISQQSGGHTFHISKLSQVDQKEYAQAWENKVKKIINDNDFENIKYEMNKKYGNSLITWQCGYMNVGHTYILKAYLFQISVIILFYILIFYIILKNRLNSLFGVNTAILYSNFLTLPVLLYFETYFPHGEWQMIPSGLIYWFFCFLFSIFIYITQNVKKHTIKDILKYLSLYILGFISFFGILISLIILSQ